MSKEITVQLVLRVRKGSLDYPSSPSSFTDDMAGVGGPSPGYMAVSPYGTDVDLSQLSDPGYCWVQNLDADNTVHYGIADPETGRFYPLGQIRPGKFVLLELSSLLFEETGTGVGTGTLGPATNRLRLRSSATTCGVRVDCFQR